MAEPSVSVVLAFLRQLHETARAAGDERAAMRLRYAILHLTPAITSEFFGEAAFVLSELTSDPPHWLAPGDAQTAEELAQSIKQRWFSTNPRIAPGDKY